MRKQKIDGVLLLDKAPGCTSNKILQKTKRLFNARKAGFIGTLDPLASGLLPLCFGESTKYSSYLQTADKTYVVEAQLGVRTDTYDSTGQVVSVAHVPSLHEAQWANILAVFTGLIRQIPPMFSALHHNGQRLYELARAGKTVVRKPREVTIHACKLLNLKSENVTLQVSCSKGTYIRTLIEDIGQYIGCGAHVIALRRTALAQYHVKEAVCLSAVEQLVATDTTQLNGLLLPIDSTLHHFPALQLEGEQVRKLFLGQKLGSVISAAGDHFRLYSKQGQFLGLGTKNESGTLVAKRLVALSQPENCWQAL